MEKIITIKNYHLGMGILILMIQMIFQISNSIYFFGLVMILFSFYESTVIKKLTSHIGKTTSDSVIKNILNEYKWLSLLVFIPIIFLVSKLIADVTQIEILKMIINHPILWINILIVGGIIIHFSITNEIKKIEKEIIHKFK